MSTSRYFAFTLDNYTKEQEEKIQKYAIENTNVLHLLYGYETAPTTGTPHLQGCFCLKNKSKCQSEKNKILIKELHIESCKKVYEANLNYCKKSGQIWQYPSEFIRENIKENKQTYAKAIELAKEGRFEEIDAEKRLKYDNQFKKIFIENKECQNMFFNNEHGNFFNEFNLFMHGPTGTGKSFRIDMILFILNKFWELYCKDRNIDYKPLRKYNKSRNKWWDDYTGEEICVLEELEPDWCQLSASNLKTWFDQYVFSGEIKGSSIQNIRPTFWIITSNYSLRELFTDKEGKLKEQDYNPIKRRLYSVEVNDITDEINWPNLDKIALYYDTITKIRIKNYDFGLKQFEKKKIKYDEYMKLQSNKFKYSKLFERNLKLINIFIPGYLDESNKTNEELNSERSCDNTSNSIELISTEDESTGRQSQGENSEVSQPYKRRRDSN